MSATTELLNFIYQNTEMGEKSLLELIEICENERFGKLLRAHCDQYSHFFNEAKVCIEQRGEQPKDIGGLQSLSSRIMLKINTLTDKYPSHLSEMLIQGATMGVINIRKKLNHYQDADAEVIEIGKHLLEFEEKTIEDYKEYL